MKKITLLTIILIIGVLIIVGCSNTVMETPVNLDAKEDLLEELPNSEVMVVGYNSDDEEEIFGDISMEEIDRIIDKIVKEVSEDKMYEDNIDSIIEKSFKESEIYEDEDYENNLGSIIEKVFREAGIDDPSKLDAAKSTIIVSYSH